MEIQPITMPLPPSPATVRPTTVDGPTFEGLLGKAMQDLADLQRRADQLAVQMATGDEVNLVDAVLAMEEASLGFKLALQVRNKALEAYQDVMRMQV